jgi:hypothetical protein
VRDLSLPVHESQQSGITQAADVCVARLTEALARVHVENLGGNKIMSAWVPGAESAIKTYRARREA